MASRLLELHDASVFTRTSHYSFCVGHGLDVRERHPFVLPAFQRPAVWSDEQKSRFIESLWLKLPIGSYCYHHSDDGAETVFELLDGQQRWSAIYDFVDNKISAFDCWAKDMGTVERRCFDNCLFPAHVARGFSEADKLEIYERLAYGGVPNIKGESVGEVRRLANKEEQ